MFGQLSRLNKNFLPLKKLYFWLLGTLPWHSTDDLPRGRIAYIRDLYAGRKYELRVVTRSDMGESISHVHEAIAGHNPGESGGYNPGESGGYNPGESGGLQQVGISR